MERQPASIAPEARAPVGTTRCRICGEAGDNPRYTAREMMHGTREEFGYFECAACGCLQIETIPEDLSPYYHAQYHSFSEPDEERIVKRYLKRKRTEHLLGRESRLGAWLLRRYGPPRWAEWMQRAGVSFDDPILDVGCGAGHLLRQMRDAGFSRLTGIDPFIERDMDLGGGLSLLRRSLPDLSGEFRLVMLHHSFEHIPGPEEALREVYRLLCPGGTALIRIPVAGCLAWRMYGADWVQLDAPRHLHLHTEASMRTLAARTGFDTADVVYDSTAFQFWASEQYRRDVPLTDPRSYLVEPARSGFSPEQIAAYGTRAEELNRSGEGDQACFYLRKS